ncbi:MAG: VOC family protein [Planctomycetota bacterium]|nr:VOC family protein [Planctomycetota bacterium]
MSACCEPTCCSGPKDEAAATAAPALKEVPAQAAGPKVHIHLHTPDLAGSVAFYRSFFGEAPVKRKDDYAKFLPAWAPVNLALSPGHEEGAAAGHFGIQLATPEAVREHLARVKAAGLPVREEMNVDCCHANQDKFWVRDPSGVEWEIYCLNYDLEGPQSANAGAQACCAR